MTPNTPPEELFRREKERSLSERGSVLTQILDEAKAAFEKMMAEGQAARKSGRPRKNPLPPPKFMAAVEPVVEVIAPVKPPPKRPDVKSGAKKKSASATGKKSATRRPAAKRGAKRPGAKHSSAKKRPAKSAAKRGKRR
jgi:hypothetical protein